jgi:hypothetical protein
MSSQHIEATSGLCLGELVCTKQDKQNDGSYNLHFERGRSSLSALPFTGSKLKLGNRVVISVDRPEGVKGLEVQHFYVSSATVQNIEAITSFCTPCSTSATTFSFHPLTPIDFKSKHFPPVPHLFFLEPSL